MQLRESGDDEKREKEEEVQEIKKDLSNNKGKEVSFIGECLIQRKHATIKNLSNAFQKTSELSRKIELRGCKLCFQVRSRYLQVSRALKFKLSEYARGRVGKDRK